MLFTDRPLRLGTRGSPLALAQARMTAQALIAAHGWSADAIEIITVQTSGDRIQDRALADIGGKALWTKELDRALVAGETDLSVHSMKDVETLRPDIFHIAAMLPRADVRDKLVGAADFDALPANPLVGTSSPRRGAQVKRLRPDATITLFRGNVATRLTIPPGNVRLSCDFVIEDSGDPDQRSPSGPQMPVEELPDAVMPFLLGSRYCETDRLMDVAWAQFGHLASARERVEAIVGFVHHHIEFRPVIAVLLGDTAVEIQHLPTDPHAQRGRRLPQRPNLVIAGQKRPRDGVHHTHDVMIGREQARQTLGGQIVGNRAINPSSGRQIGLCLSSFILGLQHHCGEHTGNSTGSHRRRAQINVG